MTITKSNQNNLPNINDIKKRSLLPTNDLIFQCLFGTKGNEKITKNFIENILNRPVGDIKLDLNVNLSKNYYDNKLGILDVRAKCRDGTNFNIEMQNVTLKMLPERVLSYWSRLYTGDLKIGNDYDSLNKTITILIVNDDIKNLKLAENFHTKWNIREETYSNIILTDYLEIHIIELKKYLRMKSNKTKNIWLDFILEPDGKEVLDAMKQNKQLKEARSKLREITEDDILRDRALRLEIARLDYNTGLREAREDGIEERY